MDKRLHPKTERHLVKQDAFDYEKFGKAVKYGRLLQELRQEDLAECIGCVRSTISKCERGMAIAPGYMIRLCAKFKLNILDYCIIDEVH